MTPREKPLPKIDKVLLSKILDSMEESKDFIKRSTTTIYGDEQAGINGLVNDVKAHKRRLNAHDKIVWLSTGFLFAIEGFVKFFKS